MSDLENAARRLRDSVAALPDQLQTEWRQGQLEGRAIVDRQGFVLFRPPHGEPLAALIALTASPPTVALVADLLDAVERSLWVGSDTVMDEHIGASRRLRETAHALASAILNDQERP